MKGIRKGFLFLPLIASLTACGFDMVNTSDYATVYPTTAGCCNAVVVNQPCCKKVIVKPVVKRSCCTKVITRPVTTSCCSSSSSSSLSSYSLVNTPSYDTMTAVNVEPVDVTSVSYDYY